MHSDSLLWGEGQRNKYHLKSSNVVHIDLWSYDFLKNVGFSIFQNQGDSKEVVLRVSSFIMPY